MTPRIVGYARGPRGRIDWRNVAEAAVMAAVAFTACAALCALTVWCLWGWLTQ